jgi:hypothetical protein
MCGGIPDRFMAREHAIIEGIASQCGSGLAREEAVSVEINVA